MSVLDIRSMKEEKVKALRFDDESDDFASMVEIMPDGTLQITSETNSDFVHIRNRSSLRSLVKALEYIDSESLVLEEINIRGEEFD